MIGHGRPRSLDRHRCVLLRGAVLVALVAAWLTPALADDGTTMRVRIAWGGGIAKKWYGKVVLSDGSLSEPRPLGLEADEPGSMWRSDEVIQVRQKGPHSYDAFDVDVRAPLSATLTIELHDAETGTAARPIDVSLRSLVSDSVSHDLDDVRNRLIVRRSPGDSLPVEFGRDSLVFSPGETFECTVAPRLLPVESGSRVRFRCQLQDAVGPRVFWSHEAEQTSVEGQGQRMPLSVKLPVTEGVYDLLIEAYPRRNPLMLSLKQQPIAVRRVQLVVVSPQAPPAGDSSLSTIFEFDPARPHWWERLTHLPALPTNRKGPVGTGQTHIWQHPLGPMVQLAPGVDEANPSWEGYPVEVQQIGQPHVVEIEFPSDVPQSLAVSIVEPNAAGAVTALGVDSGIYVPDEAAASEPATLTHRLVFWPKTRNPLLLMTNLRTGSQAVYGRIRVSVLSGRLPSALESAESDERLIAGYFDRPLFPKNFGAAEVYDSAAGRSLDDWNTFYQGSTRLADYLKFAGYNALMLSILADGSCIYPSEHLQSTPRYDNGVFLSQGQDPVQKDVVELVLRVFDREQLKLIPALNLATPLPELEELKRRGERDSIGLEWIGRDGRSWCERHRGERGQAPYYNTLHPRVQQAILDLVAEVATRYGEHHSMAGLALQLSSDGYLQLPGVGWGFDDYTVEIFESDTGIRLAAEGPNRCAQRANLLLGQHRQQWTTWRATRMSDFYRRVQQRLASVRPDLKLYLAGADLFKTAELRAALRPTLPPRPLDDTLLEVGVDTDVLAAEAGIVLLRPQQFSAPTPRATPLLDLKVNDIAELDRDLRSAATRGAIFYHQPYRQPLVSFDQRGPFRNSQLWLVAQLLPAGDRNRQRFVRSLATLDAEMMFDGGWLLGLGQEESVRELMSTFRRLPRGEWQTLSLECQPVVVRTLVKDQKGYAYLVNDSPWPVELTLMVGGDCAVSELTGRRPLRSVDRTAAGSRLAITLRPYDLLALTCNQGAMPIESAQVVLPDAAVVGLQSRVQDFLARLIALPNQPSLDAPQNAGFEQFVGPDGRIPGWGHSEQAGVAAEIDDKKMHSGAHSLRFSSSGPVGVLASEEFDVPATGRLEVAVWLRTTQGQQPPFRVALEGIHKGERLYRHAQLGSGERAVPLSSEWSQYVAHFDNMPIDGFTTLRVRFELLGRGDVWIDDLQLHHLRFANAEHIELAKLATAADMKLNQRQISDCLRLLEGYWPQFLIAQVPLTEAPIAQRPVERQAELPESRDAEKTGERTGLLDQLRGWVPRWR